MIFYGCLVCCSHWINYFFCNWMNNTISQVLTGMQIYEWTRILSLEKTYLDLLWIPMKNVVAHLVYSCWTSMVFLAPRPYYLCTMYTNFNDYFASIRFDVAGAGACLKRYSDPSFYKTVLTSTETRKVKVQREKKSRKIKVKTWKKNSVSRWYKFAILLHFWRFLLKSKWRAFLLTLFSYLAEIWWFFTSLAKQAEI